MINDISYEIQKLGHPDYFDSVIAASSIYSSDVLLTQDQLLKENIRKLNEYQPDFYPKIDVQNWNAFYRNLTKMLKISHLDLR